MGDEKPKMDMEDSLRLEMACPNESDRQTILGPSLLNR